MAEYTGITNDHRHSLTSAAPNAPVTPSSLSVDTLWAAKGDLVKGTGNDAANILSIGTNGKVLKVSTDTPAWSYLGQAVMVAASDATDAEKAAALASGGVVCDGTQDFADFNTLISAGIKNIQASSGTFIDAVNSIVFPKSYTDDVLKSAVTIRGQGVGVTKFKYTGATGYLTTFDGSVDNAQISQSNILADCVLQSDTTTDGLIHFGGSGWNLFENCQFVIPKGYIAKCALSTYGSMNLLNTFRRCYCEGNGQVRYGIYSPVASQFVLDNCNFVTCKNDLINFTGTADILLWIRDTQFACSIDTYRNTAEALDDSETGVDCDSSCVGVVYVGDVIQVELEKMLVSAINPDSPYTLTVERGYGGTSAVAHDTGKDIEWGSNHYNISMAGGICTLYNMYWDRGGGNFTHYTRLYLNGACNVTNLGADKTCYIMPEAYPYTWGQFYLQANSDLEDKSSFWKKTYPANRHMLEDSENQSTMDNDVVDSDASTGYCTRTKDGHQYDYFLVHYFGYYTHLPFGYYRITIRMKDTDQVAGDAFIYMNNYIDSRLLVSATYTLTSTYKDYYLVFKLDRSSDIGDSLLLGGYKATDSGGTHNKISCDKVTYEYLGSDLADYSVGGGHQLIQVSDIASLPTASANYRGMIAMIQGGTGVTDKLYMCMKSAADTYSWVSTMNGGSGGIASGVLAAGNANDITFAWHCPYTFDILSIRVVINITAAGGTAGALLDVGIADDATGTNLGNEFFDDADLNTVGVIDSTLTIGAGSQTVWVLVQDSASATDGWIVGKILVQNAASLAGKYYIEYTGV